ncbi:hypothetical protein D3C76_1060140 [compost metagenome]
MTSSWLPIASSLSCLVRSAALIVVTCGVAIGAAVGAGVAVGAVVAVGTVGDVGTGGDVGTVGEVGTGVGVVSGSGAPFRSTIRPSTAEVPAVTVPTSLRYFVNTSKSGRYSRFTRPSL